MHNTDEELNLLESGESPPAQEVAEASDEGSESVGELGIFDLLLAEGQAAIEERALLKANKKLLAHGKLSKADAERLKLTIEEIEVGQTWEDVANVAMFAKQTCNCGSKQTFFVQFLLEQKHLREKGAFRWSAISAPKGGNLPKRTTFEYTATLICPSCAGEFGWEVEEAKEFKKTSGEDVLGDSTDGLVDDLLDLIEGGRNETL